MLTYVLLFMIGTKLNMGTAYYVCLAIGACLKCIQAGIELQKKSK
jgi:hypothetical protein